MGWLQSQQSLEASLPCHLTESTLSMPDEAQQQSDYELATN